MKLGVCRGLDDFEAMEAAARIGIDYWECSFNSLARCMDEKFELCKSTLDGYGIPCLAANSFLPSDIMVVGDNVDYEIINDYLDKGFERAKLMGVKKVVFGSGRSRSYNDGFSAEKAMEQLAFFLSEYAAPKAKKANCIIVIEPLSFSETKMIHTVSDSVSLARLSGADNVYGLADLFHVYSNKDSFEEIKSFKGLVKHAHIAEPLSRCYPTPEDSDESRDICIDFLKTMKTVGCDTVSVEARTDDFNKDFGIAAPYLRKIINEI